MCAGWKHLRAGTTTRCIQELLAFELFAQEQVWFHVENTAVAHEPHTVMTTIAC